MFLHPLAHQPLCLLFVYTSPNFHFAKGLPSVCSFNRLPLHTLPLDYGYSYAVPGVKLESSRFIAAGRLLYAILSRPVRARAAAVLRTHFLFEVNHVEVYNNIKFPFTRFVGSALFLRQKTHSPHPMVRRRRRVFIYYLA